MRQSLSALDPPNAGAPMSTGPAIAEERARLAEERAVRAHQHATAALQRAILDAAHGDARHELRHRQEAALHQRAAARQEEAVALQRLHAEHLRQHE